MDQDHDRDPKATPWIDSQQPETTAMGASEGIKRESAADSPLLLPPPPPPPAAAAAAAAAAADQLPALKSSPTPFPSTETLDPAESTTPMRPVQAATTTTTTTNSGISSSGVRKKIISSSSSSSSSIIKKAPKRSRSGGDVKRTKRAKAAQALGTDEDDESDGGPYCICRGPDDHRWMICCEKCEDWFHGECVHIGKDVGENLVEKFVCPNCTTAEVVTMYKKTCALNGCRRAARLRQKPASVFCSNEHAQTWWERTLARLPRARAAGAPAVMSDELSQEELMALLGSGLAGVDADGAWRLKAPFSGTDDIGTDFLTDEEAQHLDSMAKSRSRLAEETALYHKMLALIDAVQDRRRAAVAAGRFADDICGYDDRLDAVGARDAFAAFMEGEEGGEGQPRVDDAPGEGDKGMCERKRCKAHNGWQKMLVLGIKHQIREMEDQAAEAAEEERIVREAAGERWRRRRAERNWVEVVEG